MITVPTKITEKQYEDAFFFINKDTADHYLLYQDAYGVDRDLWVCRDENSLKNTNSENIQNLQKVKGQYFTDENGELAAADGYIFPTSESLNDLDINALAEGRIEWI